MVKIQTTIDDKTESLLVSERKRMFLELFEKNAGNISVACRKMNISRSTYNQWLYADEEFKMKIIDAREALIDFAESKLMQKISEGDTACILFYLKTKGKSRGYIERQEVSADVRFSFKDVKVNIVHRTNDDLKKVVEAVKEIDGQLQQLDS